MSGEAKIMLPRRTLQDRRSTELKETEVSGTIAEQEERDTMSFSL